MPTVKEEWNIIDQWWKSEAEWIRREFAVVIWYEREIMFRRELPDPVWRIVTIERNNG